MLSVTSQAAQLYQLVVLDDGTNESCAYGVNNFGFSVGYKKVAGVMKPCLWTPARGYLELPRAVQATDPHGIAYAINDKFSVVGTYGATNVSSHRIDVGAVVGWNWDGEMGQFSTKALADGMIGNSRDINSNGDAACTRYGYAWCACIDNMYTDAVQYSCAFSGSACYGINEQGNAVGQRYSYYANANVPIYYRKNSDGSYASTSSDGMFLDIGNSACYDINSNNVAVGSSDQAGFYWEPDKYSLNMFPISTRCYSINNASTIVGSSNGVACMWEKGTNGSYKCTDLNKLATSTIPGIVMRKAFRISDAGQIVGQCVNTNTGVQSAFMLTPAVRAPRCLKKAPNNQLEFNWLVTEGHTYAFRFSEDLKSWVSYPDLYYADTSTDVSVFFSIDDMPKAFIDIVDTTP